MRAHSSTLSLWLGNNRRTSCHPQRARYIPHDRHVALYQMDIPLSTEQGKPVRLLRATLDYWPVCSGILGARLRIANNSDHLDGISLSLSLSVLVIFVDSCESPPRGTKMMDIRLIFTIIRGIPL